MKFGCVHRMAQIIICCTSGCILCQTCGTAVVTKRVANSLGEWTCERGNVGTVKERVRQCDWLVNNRRR